MSQCECEGCEKVKESVDAVLACLKETTDDKIQALAVLDLVKALVLHKTLTIQTDKTGELSYVF